MRTLFFLTILTLTLLSACEESQPEAVDYAQQAQELAHRFVIVDGHVDLPYRMKVENFQLQREYLSIARRTEGGHFDLERARLGGLDAPFMSIFIPSSYQQTEGAAFALADSLIDMVERLQTTLDSQVAIAGSPDEIIANHAKGVLSLPMGMENGAPIGTDLANLQHFFDRGVRYITLTHAKDNEICDSSYDSTRTWNGLSPFGREVVPEMNRIGYLVDISHVSDSTFYQVMDLTEAPCIASHSSARYFTPGLHRNMSDAMLQRLAENGGVVMVNFGSYFTGNLRKDSLLAHRPELLRFLQEQEAAYFDSAYQAYASQFWGPEDQELGTVQVAADQIDHIVAVAGIDHVGIGSDFDGVGQVPVGLSDVSMYPNLIEELLRRGYSEADIEKICSGNLFRVWREVAATAERLQRARG